MNPSAILKNTIIRTQQNFASISKQHNHLNVLGKSFNLCMTKGTFTSEHNNHCLQNIILEIAATSELSLVDVIAKQYDEEHTIEMSITTKLIHQFKKLTLNHDNQQISHKNQNKVSTKK